jgi:solute carrier family 9B (sodium/hydrogen exchanger), member 1/2
MTFEALFFAIFAGGWLVSRLFDRLRLPGVMGMVLFGIGLAVVLGQVADHGPLGASTVNIWPEGFAQIVPFIKSLALVIILLRAGLGIRRAELQAAGVTAVLMAFIPCLLEGSVLMGTFVLFFGFSWPVAGLAGFLLAAVSPAVVVPSMLELKARDLGQRNGVIATILAGASADDVLAITLFTVFLSMSTSETGGSPFVRVAFLPWSIVGGLGIGVAVGFGLAWWFRRHHAVIRATEKALLLLASAVFLVRVGDHLHLAALLGVMAVGFIVLERAEAQAHELAAKLEKVWVVAQIALFVIIGMFLDVQVAFSAGQKTLLVILIGLIARSFGVLLATWPSSMTFRERMFCVIAYTPKATVQAALGGVALSAGLPQGEVILAVAVLAILVTAPLGVLGIRWGSKHLLSEA